MKKSTFWGLVGCCLVIHSVAAAAPKEANLSPAPSFTISKELRTWNEKQSLRLQDHQLKPIAYLEKNPDIKGLVINHWLGTGKTAQGIAYAERNPGCPVVILAPGFLKGHWMKELEKYGVKNKNRYRFVSHNNPESLLEEDLSKTILIIDESHRFIEKVRSSKTGPTYAPLYLNLRKAHRVLSLTGTPIYSDLFDLVYQLNLVSGKEVLPFNEEAFRMRYSKVNAFRSYWRGYLLESNYVFLAVSVATEPLRYFLNDVVGLSKFRASIIASIPRGLYAAVPYFSSIRTSPIRTFDPKQLESLIRKYISYYNFDQDARFYPQKSLTQNALNYNDPQLSILYRFYDSRLNREELKQLLKDQITLNGKTDTSQKAHYYLNDSLVQDMYKREVGAGREIGNFLFVNQEEIEKENPDKSPSEFAQGANKYTIFPEKFDRILEEIENSKGPAVIYSHYYYNGLLLFKQFLDAKGYKESYRIFHPEVSSEKNSKIVEEYNTGKVKILLLHPDITEGISLQGTRQVHFVDIPASSELANQIIGRAIRYKSHMHLPKEEQRVAVYYWYYRFDIHGLRRRIAERANWYHNFSELDYNSLNGRKQVDRNAHLKVDTPDMLSYIHLHALDKQTEEFRRYVKTFCIENTYSEEK